MNITKVIDNGFNVYKFRSNNTDYEVLTLDHKAFLVYSARIGRAGLTAPKAYDSLEELRKRSKVFEQLAILIES